MYLLASLCTCWCICVTLYIRFAPFRRIFKILHERHGSFIWSCDASSLFLRYKITFQAKLIPMKKRCITMTSQTLPCFYCWIFLSIPWNIITFNFNFCIFLVILSPVNDLKLALDISLAYAMWNTYFLFKRLT